MPPSEPRLDPKAITVWNGADRAGVTVSPPLLGRYRPRFSPSGIGATPPLIHALSSTLGTADASAKLCCDLERYTLDNNGGPARVLAGDEAGAPEVSPWPRTPGQPSPGSDGWEDFASGVHVGVELLRSL